MTGVAGQGVSEPGAAHQAAHSPPANCAADYRCRNCDAPAPGRFCPRCGQETAIGLPSAGTFLRDAAGRYLALDSRLWRTLLGLLIRPGFLTQEYLAGRRRRYVRPARLFFVLSIALFATLRVVGEPPTLVQPEPGAVDCRPSAGSEDADLSGIGISIEPDCDLRLGSGWLLRGPLKSRIDSFNRLTPQQKSEQIFAGMMRFGPYAAVGLLPFYALLLRVVYLGRARRYPLRPRRYGAHLVYAAHKHAFVFLIGVLLALIPSRPIQAVLVIWAMIYGVASMKAVYDGRLKGVVARAVLVAVAYSVFFLIALVALVVAAVALR